MELETTITIPMYAKGIIREMVRLDIENSARFLKVNGADGKNHIELMKKTMKALSGEDREDREVRKDERMRVAKFIEKRADELADMAIYGLPDNSRNRESMVNALTEVKYAILSDKFSDFISDTNA